MIISVSELERRYPNQWIAIGVTSTDEDGFATAGELLAHDADEVAVWSVLRLREPTLPVYIFHTGRAKRVAA